MQKERQEKQEKEEEEKKEKQRQQAEEMIRQMHEGADSLEDRLAAITEQRGETKAPTLVEESSAAVTAQVPEVVGETVEIDGDVSSSATGTNTDKTVKTSTSTSSSEDIDDETLEGEEGVAKIGKDGKSRINKIVQNK